MTDSPLVCVVDDDESLRESLPPLLGELGFRAEAFASAEEFLGSGRLKDAHGLILDIAMPGMSGPELYRELQARQQPIPVIFITANGSDLRNEVRTIGEVACLSKPFSDVALLQALEAALS
jgi:FixJ family two-component response regulator